MDMKRFSLIKEHEKHFQVHDSKDNTHFSIAKKDVHPATQLKIMKLQKFDDGGAVQGAGPGGDIEQRLRSDYQGADRIDEPNAIGDPNNPPSTPDTSPVPVAQDGPMSVGSATPPQLNQSSNQAEMPQGGFQKPGYTPDVMQQFNNNQQMEENALTKKGQAEADLGNANAKTYADANTKMAVFMKHSQEVADQQNADNEKLAQDVASTKIDPKRYVNNMTTGEKIMHAILAAIGGIGAGMTHSQPLALGAINKNINDDIESQKADLGKKQSLLSTNLAKYKDMRLAEQATMMQMNSMVQGQIAQQSAKYGGTIAQQNAMSLLGQMKQQGLSQSMNLQQQVFQQHIAQHLAGGDVSKDNPLDYVRYTVPPDKQKDVATELGKAVYAKNNHQYLMNLWDKAQQEQTMARTGFGIWDAPATKELKNLTDPLIKDSEGRITPMESEHLQGVFPSSGQTDARQKELRQGFERFVMGKMEAPLAKSNGIDITRFDMTKPQPSNTQVERVINNGPHAGKIGVFDGNTKAFLGFK